MQFSEHNNGCTMLALPMCEHRGGEVIPGHYSCASQWLLTSTGYVQGEFCQKTCPYVNKPNPPARRTVLALWLYRWRLAQWRCKDCSLFAWLCLAKAENPPCLNCAPGIATQVLTFVKAAAKHVIAGMPTVSEAKFQERLAICRACPAYDAANHACKRCGCNAGKGLLDKLRWSGSVCPEGKWNAVV